MKHSPRVLVLAGEASGEMHAAALVRDIARIDPSISFVGIGGCEMAAAGVELLGHCEEIGVVGGVEGLHSLPEVLKTYKRVKRLLASGEVDLFIPVDYPGMNLRLACHAHKCGIPVCYYISPQVWAWRERRIKTIARCVDRMMVILPFEEAIYRKAGIDAHYVGHPLLDSVRPTLKREEFRKRCGIPRESLLVTLMPGSRPKEVGYNLPVMLRAAGLISREVPDAQFALALAPTLKPSQVGVYLSKPGTPPVRIFKGDTYSLIGASDGALVASGTATLEVALLGIPMVVVYRVHPSTYEIGKRLVRVRWLSLVNNVLQEGAVPEFIQHAATPEEVSRGLLRRIEMVEESRELAQRLKGVLSPPEGFRRASELVLEMLREAR